MLKQQICFLLLFMGLCLPGAYSKEYPTLHYSVNDGLPSRKIYEIYRDSKGYLWFATDKGIARYNGMKFEKFTTFNGLSDNEVFFFQEDIYGRIWMGTLNGQLCYFKNDTFYSAVNAPFLALSIKASFIKQISCEKDSSVTILFNEQSVFLNIKKDKCNEFSIPNEYNKNKIIYEVRWIKKMEGTGYRVDCWDKTVYIDSNDKIWKISEDEKEVNFMRLFGQNQAYLYKDNYIYTEDKKPYRKIFSHIVKYTWLHRIYINQDHFFLATDNGVIIDDSIKILPHCKVSGITQDIAGNYWFGTLNDGVHCLNKNFSAQKVISNLYSGQVSYSTIKNGNVFFTTSDDNLYKLENQEKKCLYHYPYKRYKFQLEPGCLIDDNYKYYNTFYTNHIVLDDIRKKKPQISRYTDFFKTASLRYLLARDNDLYFLHKRSIIRINYSLVHPGKDVAAKSEYITDDNTYPYRIFCMGQAPDKNIWYTTINEVYKIVDTNRILQRQFGNITFKTFSFAGRYLVGFTQDNRLLVCHNPEQKMTVDTVLGQNCIWEKMYNIDSNHVLISTNNLYRIITFHPENIHAPFSVVTVDNPFIPSLAESVCGDTSRCYFFKDGIVTSVDFNSLLVTPATPLLDYTFLKTNKKAYSIVSGIEIPYSESGNISVAFSTLSFSSNDVTYEYSATTDNKKDNWQQIKGDINLVGAHWGNYVIKVKAKTMSSDYSVPIVFSFTILHPFWASWWFITLMICMMFLIVWLTIRRRIASLIYKREQEHTLQVRYLKSEYKALNALMNPHFIFNALNNVQGLFNSDDKRNANKYLRIFANLIRLNMHNISLDLIPLQKEIELISSYLALEQLRFKDKLNFTINIDEGIDLSYIMVPPLLIQPLVENSIKHGILPKENGKGKIEINIYERSNTLVIEVKDDGVGLNHTYNTDGTLHQSFGLENIKNRIRQLSIIQNKEITFHISGGLDGHSDHQWTIATITMPAS